MATSTLSRDAQLSTLANAAYLDKPPTTIGSWNRVGDPHLTASGFFGVTYYNAETKQVVVSFRGTNGGNDLLAATTFGTGGWNQQFTDAALYTKQVQDEIAAKPQLYSGAALLTTGHSLGGGISQIIATMFGLNGSSYEAPGASNVTSNPEFAVIKSQYARDRAGAIGTSFTNYRAEGSVISSVGKALGQTQNMVSLTDAGAMSFASAALAIAGVSTGGFGGLIASALGVTGINVDSHHSMDGMERTMYLAAGLEKAISNGSLKMATVSLSQATGQVWTGVGVEPQVTIFKDVNNQVAAYIQKEGTGWKLSTPDQETTILLTPAAKAGQSPTCTVKEPGKDSYACTVTEEDGDITRNTDVNGDGVVDQSSTLYDDGSKITSTHSVNEDGEAWAREELDANGNISEFETAVYDSKKGLTEVDVYRYGKLIGHSTIQGKSTQAQLGKVLALSEQLAEATSFGGAGMSDSGESFIDALNILDEQETSQLTTGVQNFYFVDTKYSGNNVASTPFLTTLSDYATWLKGRGTSTNVNNDLVADPSLLGLQDGALTVALARQNPNPVNVIQALQSVVLAGGVLSESFKQSVADQLGTNTANVNAWVAGGGAAITSFLLAMNKPTVANVTTAAISLINAGVVFTPALKQVFADKLGFTGPTAISDFNSMLAYGGAGLAVASVLKNPTPQNIVAATQQITGMLGAMQGSASLQNLSYNLGNSTAVFSVYNFSKNPNKQTAVSAMLSVAMRMPSLTPYAVPLAAALTIGEMIIPGFTDKAVNALVRDIPGVAFDVTKNIIKVEVSLLRGALNLAGSVVETVGGVVNSVGNVVANAVSSAVSTGINVLRSVWRTFTPLVVNLADDPVHTTTLTATSPLFDMSGDGVKERTGWITADEGFLVRDLNGNGKIDSINEMFSERTSTTANSAFGALAELDSNKDGVISSTDAYWGTLKVWVDKNSNGETQANELYTLAQLGISNIKLNATKNFSYDNGNIIGDKSTFTYTDGRVGEIADAIFTTQDVSISRGVTQTLLTQDSTTVRLSNGQTMKVLDVHGKTLTVGSATEGVNIVTSTGGNAVTAADDANGLILIGEMGDTLNAGKGHLVTLVSNGGAKLIGNAEDNLYVVSQTSDVIIEAVNAGADTVRSSVSYTLGANLENLTLTSTAAINGTGNALNNMVIGNSANNVLDGGAGVDTLKGGVGDDIYVVDSSMDMIVENAGEGTDTVQSSVSYSLANVSNVENLTLTGALSNNGTGNNLNNVITGNNCGNTLDGGAGADRLVGLAGDDTYVVDNVGDVVVENAMDGSDTVNASVSYKLTANVEYLRLQGSGAINGTGNELSNTLYGNSAANVLDGGASNDVLIGGAGNDTYVFGRGSERDDVYDEDSTVGNVDTVQLGAGISVNDVVVTRDLQNMYLNIVGTMDRLTLSGWFVNDILRIEQVRFANGTVWDANMLVAKTNAGTAGKDYLRGTTGADRLAGLAGDDTYVVDNAGDVVVESAFEGSDTVNASVSYKLASNVEVLYLQGNSAINGTGNELSNTIYGNSAANVLDGGVGTDYLCGGSGNDTYVFGRGSGLDTVYDEDRTIGNVDTVQLGAGINVNDVVVTREFDDMHLSIAGTKDKLKLSGWFANDILRIEQVRFANGTVWDVNTLIAKVKGGSGTKGNDYLSGTTGADSLAGLAGEDTYLVDNVGDVVIENENEGYDGVNASVSYKLAANVEYMFLTGSDAINATGNELDNTLTGNSAANVFDGGAGNDDLVDWSGGNDIYVFRRGSGQDTVCDFDYKGAGTDVLSFVSGVATDQLWLKRVDNDLEVSIIGSTDKATVKNWYAHRNYQIEQIKAAGKTLLNTDVEKLVQAMASLSAPASGQTILPNNYQTALAPVIAANWH